MRRIPIGSTKTKGGHQSIDKRRGTLAFLFLCCGVFSSACRQDMYNQPRIKPLAPSDFFADGQSARLPIPGTVARGQLNANRELLTGIGADGALLTVVPIPVTPQVIRRGQERFDIYCSPCHSRLGDGRGMIVRRGFKQPSSFHIDRLRGQSIGYFFDVMTQGFGQMSSYASQVPVEDRWAIAAYIRALQLSAHAPVAELPAADRAELEKKGR